MEKRAKILIVDDTSANLELCKGLLNNEFEVRLAKSGKMALKSLERFRPDIILLDIEMPEMSGFEVKNEMNKNSDFKDIPVIFVTSHATEKLVLKALEQGIVDYIVKPFESRVLRTKIRSALMQQHNKEKAATV